jgi:glycosyltransferase involved in cell wall biosynthesis
VVLVLYLQGENDFVGSPFKTDRTWLSCQLGAREHYAVPRALQRDGLLDAFLTDLWIPPNSLTGRWVKKRGRRFHPALAQARVSAANAAAFAFEMKSQAGGINGWDLTVRRNEWFGRNVVARLKRGADTSGRERTTVFAYSYAAEHIFNHARERGWRTVLGQIDPGPAHEEIVARLHQHGNGDRWQPAPVDYWRKWRRECELADTIVVNSNWSREALLAEAIPESKIRVIPLAFEASKEAGTFQRQYPSVFNPARPLRVLFLAQINLLKGARELLEAAILLANEPVEFWFVGPQQIHIPPDLRHTSYVKWFGAVPRTRVDSFYRAADVFILPTFSDGFALTQLEAQSWKLPVIASRFCGEVVQHDRNGLLLEEVSAEAIAKVLSELLRTPQRLAAMARESYVREEFSLKTLASSLSQL